MQSKRGRLFLRLPLLPRLPLPYLSNRKTIKCCCTLTCFDDSLISSRRFFFCSLPFLSSPLFIVRSHHHCISCPFRIHSFVNGERCRPNRKKIENTKKNDGFSSEHTRDGVRTPDLKKKNIFIRQRSKIASSENLSLRCSAPTPTLTSGAVVALAFSTF